MKTLKKAKTLVAAIVLGLGVSQVQASDQSLLNSSYDIARELFASYNEHFAQYWQEKTGQTVEVRQSHGGSSRQAQAIIEGLRADVVTFNQVTDIDILHQRGKLVPADWRDQLPNASSPYYSTMAYLVREGNPKNIQNWDDLAREDVSSVFPNPKTSGNGRYTYLAAYGYAQQAFPEDQEAIDSFVRTFLNRVAVFDTGGRGATTTFVERGIGDVLITFESEVNNILAEFPDQNFEVVVPKVSFLAEFPVAVVERHAQRNGNLELARAYLEELYSEEAQRLLAGFNYRVHNEIVQQEFSEQFPEVELLTIEQIAGSWDSAMEVHFASGGKLDQLQRR
ncbi:MAG: sulfate ABC transporter substrate-binding protein [Oceanospirillales bacterium]|nr:MAG: sulfate ABC transporter substrate-binding protein [Oceanospirillales bacterium]